MIIIISNSTYEETNQPIGISEVVTAITNLKVKEKNKCMYCSQIIWCC